MIKKDYQPRHRWTSKRPRRHARLYLAALALTILGLLISHVLDNDRSSVEHTQLDHSKHLVPIPTHQTKAHSAQTSHTSQHPTASNTSSNTARLDHIHPNRPTTFAVLPPDKQSSTTEAISPLDVVKRRLNPWQTLTVKNGHTLAQIFTSLNQTEKMAYKLVNTSTLAKKFLNLKPGQVLEYRTDNRGKLHTLSLKTSLTETVHATYENHQFLVRKHVHPITVRQAHAQNVIQTSLSSACTSVGLNYALIEQLVHIFGWDIDFALDIRPNDQFKIIYEEKLQDGNKVGTGHILAASFTNRNKTYHAIRYVQPDDKVGYFSPDGYNLAKAFIRTPVKFTRISSKFSLKRKHPKLNTIRAHKGVDYAAPVGTPVKATGHARVQFVGHKRGYGKCIILDHGRGYTTLYGHLSKFRPYLKKGQKVSQGQVIGYVGMTGLATGPHLHYEFRIHGKHRDPLKVQLPQSKPLPIEFKEDFTAISHGMLALLDNPKKLDPTDTAEVLAYRNHE